MRALMTMAALGVVMGTGAAAQAPAPKAKAAPPAVLELTEAHVAAVHGAVKRQLRDPDSAKFEGMTARVDAKGGRMVCGLVNARNGFGGYTGAQPFVGMLAATTNKATGAAGPDVFVVLQMGGRREVEQAATRQMCAANGMKV